MQEVTCSHCGRFVQITPDAPRCSQCGESLHEHLIPQFATSYFYRRSADLAARGDLAGALDEAERGIAWHDASELRLLAAILSKRMGDMPTVRLHVAAIPVDDRLRSEAEWLIRAQPGRSSEPIERRRASATLTPDPGTDRVDSAGTPEDNATPSVLEGTTFTNPDEARNDFDAGNEVEPIPVRASGSVWAQRMWALVATVLLVIAGGMGWLLLSGGPDALLEFLNGNNAIVSGPVVDDAPLAPVTPASFVLPTATPQGTPTVPANLVSLPTPAPQANVGFVSAAQANIFDLDAVLADAGRDDLVALDLNARIDGGTIRVSGVVTNTTDRVAIVDAITAVSGVTDVNANELFVRIPETYIVKEGDSLWQIVSYYYATDAANRVAELYTLNQDTLPSASALQVGMELKMPSVD